MTEQEQIEEMARAMCEHFDVSMKNQPCTKCRTYNKNCYTIRKAKMLYNTGHRKIDDDCVVITKDELKQYKEQAVKEFAGKVKMLFYYEFDELIPSIMSDKIDELLKEYEE